MGFSDEGREAFRGVNLALFLGGLATAALVVFLVSPDADRFAVRLLRQGIGMWALLPWAANALFRRKPLRFVLFLGVTFALTVLFLR